MGNRKGIKVTEQRKDWDCGIASLAMLLSKPYADVSAACRNRYGTTKRPNKRGLLLNHMEELAELFDTKLKRIYIGKNYLEGRTGILGMNGGQMDSAGHWVILKDGTHVVDPDGGEVWKLEDYLKKFNCRTATILVIDK